MPTGGGGGGVDLPSCATHTIGLIMEILQAVQ